MKQVRGHEFTVFEARLDDAQEIAALHLNAWANAHPHLPSRAPDTCSISDWERRWTTRLSLEHGMDYFALVARAPNDPRILGFADAGASRDHDKRGFGEVYELSVDPRHESTDVARTLLTTVVNRLKNASFIGAHLWVGEDNVSLISLYRSFGWKMDRQRQELIASGVWVTEERFGTSWSFRSPS